MFVTVIALYRSLSKACLVFVEMPCLLRNPVTHTLPGLLLMKAILACRSAGRLSTNSFVKKDILDRSSGQPRVVKVFTLSKIAFSLAAVSLFGRPGLLPHLETESTEFHRKLRADSRTYAPSRTASTAGLFAGWTMTDLRNFGLCLKSYGMFL